VRQLPLKTAYIIIIWPLFLQADCRDCQPALQNILFPAAGIRAFCAKQGIIGAPL